MTIKRSKGIKACLLFIALYCFCSLAHAEENANFIRPGKLFSPSKIHLLEDPKRDAWQKPEKIISALGVEKGQIIADIGAGSGYLTEKLSDYVGIEGIVYAVDIQREMLDYIAKRLKDKKPENVTLVLGTMDDPKLPRGEHLDTAILLSTYHEIAKPIDFLKKVKHALKPHGKLAILEFGSKSPIGPPASVRLPEELVINELKQAGFSLQQKHTFLLPYQYFLVFTPSYP
ncbi:MAG: methyltransferase domain-containing protein [Candidatus Brocadiaceae bacterium]|nr:methyltransferase domain-containing protein [Candidatus Brocadiaceae bacterium]